MKKSLFAPLLCVIMLLIMPCIKVCAYQSSSPDGAVYDEADFLTDEQTSELTAYAQKVADNTGWNVLVYVTDDPGITENNMRSFCEKKYEAFYDYHEDGVVFLCDKNYVNITGFGDVNSRISPFAADRIAGLGDSLYSTDIPASIRAVLDGIDDYIYNPQINPEQTDSPPISTGAFVLAAIFALIALFATMKGIKTAYTTYAKPTTNNYVDNATLRFTQRNDTFVKEFTTVTTHSSSSGSRGSRGGGHHSSVSGGHHR